MWIPSHVGLEINKLVNERACHATLNGAVFDRPLLSVNFQGLARSVLLSGTLQILVDSLISYSRRFLFDLGLGVKGKTRNFFLCIENNIWSLCRSFTLELI
jgi:hypothetical protein